MPRKTKTRTLADMHGGTLDDFLAEEGILEECNAAALKSVIAWQFTQAMKQKRVSKTEMAARMNTSRAAVNRLLDQDGKALTIETITRAARALGYRAVKMELVA